MGFINRLYQFETEPTINPDIGRKIDEELNQILSLVNGALDDVNIDGTPPIQSSKLALAGTGFLPLGGGTMTGLLEHLFAGVWRRMGAAGTALVREYRDTGAGVLWGLVYNTSYLGPGWTGRDANDLCWRVEMSTTGQFRYLTAPSAAAGIAPVWLPIKVLPPFGRAPSSVGVGSPVAYEGDVTISVSQGLEGLHYYNTLTINGGVTVTVGKYLILVAREAITVAGTITANGQGMPGGAGGGGAGGNSTAGTDGRVGAGGGGGGGLSNPGKVGGSASQFGETFAGGSAGTSGGANGGVGTALSARYKSALVATVLSSLMGGAGGGGGEGDGGAGGAGGGVIVLIAPRINLSGATITANGAAGANAPGATNSGGGGGGGGGLIFIETQEYTAPSTMTAIGGAGGTEASGGGNGTDGGAGGAGVVQVNIVA